MADGSVPRPSGPRSGRSALLLVPAVLLLTFVVAATLTLLPAAATVALLSAGSAGFAVAIVRAVARGRSAGPRLRALTVAGGVLLAGAAGTAAGIAAVVAPDALVAEVPLPAEIPLVCLFLVTALFLPGLLRPHQRRDPLARLRAGLEVVGVTAGLIFTPWLLIFSTAVEPRGASLTALIFGSGATAAVAVAGVHAVRHRAALQWCAPGAALTLIAMTALVIAMDHLHEPNAVIAAVVAAGALNAAAALLWHGTVRIHPDAGLLRPVGSESSAGFPLFALPVLASVLVTAFYLINGGRLDPMSIILATTTLLAVGAREYLASITLRRHADHLTDQGNRLRSLVFGSSDVAMILDADLAVRWQSPAAARQFGLSDHDVLGRPAAALVHPAQAEQVHAYLAARVGPPVPPARIDPALPVRLRDGFGRWRETEWTTNGSDPAEPGHTLVVHVRDVSDQRDLEQALRQSTHLDQQTSLANRQGLRRAGDPVPDTGAMIMIQIGGLTAIGDMHGPDLAEVVVVEAARRLRGRVENADVPARLGENRFAVLTRSGAVRAHLLASQLINALTAPYSAAGTVAHLSAWAGLADLTADADIDEVIRRATLALRAVRSAPPGAIEWYDEEMEIRLLRRSTLERSLPGAVARGELDLLYQPVVELPSGRPVGVEALLSWRHPELGPVPAAELLALAEDLGLHGEVMRWALHRAGRSLVEWRQVHDSLWLAINVRPSELVDPSFQAALHSVLETQRIPPSALVVEMAEQDLLRVRDAQQPAFEDVVAQLGRLRAEGVRTAVDNFGTGPTSLSRLRVLPVDLLKIDRDVFGQPADPSRQLGAIMDVTVTLGRRLGMEVIAHGLQSPDDLATVQAAGCRLGQGDLLGRAMPAERLEALLHDHREALRRDG